MDAHEALAWKARKTGLQAGYLDLLPYLKLKLLLESIADPRRVHFANAAAIQETPIVNS